MPTKPFIKWAGGKTQLIDVVMPLMPREYNNYIEPFLGGGAIFLEIQPEKAIINDLNNELITAYQFIKENPTALINNLKKMVEEHNEADSANDYYKTIREQNPNNLDNLGIASRFIYLNKTGFNGLYRVNQSGGFNVPFGKKETIQNTTIFSQTNLRRISKILQQQDVIIENRDFEEIIDMSEEGDFIFVDSPYDEAFTGYSAGGFGESEHIRLSESLKRATERGVKWMTTNHNTVLIQELYKENDFFEVPVNRFINSDAKNRANATSEVIVINYKGELREKNLRMFEEAKFYKQLKGTSFVLKDYIKWESIQRRINENRLYLNDLNLLHANSKEQFLEKFKELHADRPESFCILPLLLANRSTEYRYWLESGESETFDWLNEENTYSFLEESGLIENLFINSAYGNVFDYLLGLEVGITSADKKNLVGAWMSHQIELLLEQKNIEYEKEVPYEVIVPANRIKSKHFDYVFKIDGETYCMEVNFFNTSGSKIPSESSRFIELDNQFRNYEDIHFVWVTDGIGLRKNKSSINQALRNVNHLYNLTTFAEFLERMI